LRRRMAGTGWCGSSKATRHFGERPVVCRRNFRPGVRAGRRRSRRSGSFFVEGERRPRRSGSFFVEGKRCLGRSGSSVVDGERCRRRSGSLFVDGKRWPRRSGPLFVEGERCPRRSGSLFVEGKEAQGSVAEVVAAKQACVGAFFHDSETIP